MGVLREQCGADRARLGDLAKDVHERMERNTREVRRGPWTRLWKLVLLPADPRDAEEPHVLAPPRVPLVVVVERPVGVPKDVRAARDGSVYGLQNAYEASRLPDGRVDEAALRDQLWEV